MEQLNPTAWETSFCHCLRVLPRSEGAKYWDDEYRNRSDTADRVANKAQTDYNTAAANFRKAESQALGELLTLVDLDRDHEASAVQPGDGSRSVAAACAGGERPVKSRMALSRAALSVPQDS